MSYQLLVLILGSATFLASEALQCYQCYAYLPNSDCSDNKDPPKECSTGFCGYFELPGENDYKLVKNCADNYKEFCADRKTRDNKCGVCDTDECNKVPIDSEPSPEPPGGEIDLNGNVILKKSSVNTTKDSISITKWINNENEFLTLIEELQSFDPKNSYFDQNNGSTELPSFRATNNYFNRNNDTTVVKTNSRDLDVQ